MEANVAAARFFLRIISSVLLITNSCKTCVPTLRMYLYSSCIRVLAPGGGVTAGKITSIQWEGVSGRYTYTREEEEPDTAEVSGSTPPLMFPFSSFPPPFSPASINSCGIRGPSIEPHITIERGGGIPKCNAVYVLYILPYPPLPLINPQRTKNDVMIGFRL